MSGSLRSVSLVIPTYNRAALIGDTLASALGQTEPFAEIIVVDDGSTDDTAAVVRRAAPTARYVHTANAGVTSARATGARLAQGTHLAFLDSDDLLEPAYVSEHLARLSACPEAELSIANFRWLTDGVQSTHTKHDEAPAGYWPAARTLDPNAIVCETPLYPRLLEWQPVMVGTFVVARDAYERVGGYDPAKSRWASEDFEFALRLCHLTPTCVIHQPLMTYRRHAAQATNAQAAWMRGDVAILQHSLLQHPLGAQNAETIRRQVSLRSGDLADLAFAMRDRAAFLEHWRAMSGKDRTARRWIKRLVASTWA